MKKKIGLLLTLVFVLALSGCQTGVKEEVKETSTEPTVEVQEDAEAEVVKEEKKRIEGPFKEMIAPDFTLKDINGEEVTLSDLKGNVVLLTFWTSW